MVDTQEKKANFEVVRDLESNGEHSGYAHGETEREASPEQESAFGSWVGKSRVFAVMSGFSKRLDAPVSYTHLTLPTN